MGSITAHRDKGISNDEWFQAECFGDGRTILASATVKGVYYAAVRENATGEVSATVIPIFWSRGYDNFTWKSLSERSSGDHGAPAKVLDMLTETDDKHALEWRAACRAQLAKVAALPTMVDGTTIRLAFDLTFTVDGERLTSREFTWVARPGRRNLFRSEQGILVRLPDWKSYSFELVPA